MQRPLDPLNFKKNTYERPLQEWICGRSAEGHPCPLGPDQRGRCRATGECQPARKGDRWLCTRLEARGGKCEEGPLPDGKCCKPVPPCQPARSLRRLRGIAVWLVMASTIGGLFYLLGGKWRDSFIDPGELSAVHGASPGRGMVGTNCGECHSAQQIDAAAGGAALFSHRQLADSKLCLNCHTLGDHPLNAHAVAAPALAELTREEKSGSGREVVPVVLKIGADVRGFDPHGSDVACTTCHREHHGREANLTQIANEQCQVCHAVKFTSFAHGHPEFTDYPFKRRTRIFFDHTKHLDEYFVKDKEHAPTSCQACHKADAEGRQMLVKEFQETCAACHAGQIRGEGMETKGIAFFSIPELDVATLESKGHPIGEWPSGADGKMTPFMKLLLASDPEAHTALDELKGVELFDLSKASAAQLDAAAKVAWGIKSLLFDLLVKGQGSLLERVSAETSAGDKPMSPDLTGRMSPTVVLAAQAEWLPHLLSEVPNHRKGINPEPARRASSASTAPSAPGNSPDSGKAPAPASKTAGGDDSILDSGDLLAPPAKAGGKPPAPSKKPTAGDDSILDSSDLSTPSKTPATPGKAGKKPPAKKPAGGDDSILDSGDLLASPTPAASAKSGKAPASAKDDSSLLGDAGDLSKTPEPSKGKAASGDGGDLLSTPEPAPVKQAAPEKAPAAEVMAAEDWVATGGWYRPPGSFTLFYRPSGHADPFLVAWLTAISPITKGDSAELARTAFLTLTNPEAPGLCTKCHTVDKQEGGAMQVNWLPAHPEPHSHPFTVFNHTAHFSLLTDQGCQTCHQRNVDAEYAKFFTASDGAPPMDPSHFASNFAPLSKAICAECHKPQVAGDNCLLCHLYHTGVFEPKVKEAAAFRSPARKDVGQIP